jgi:hypothetical protein
LIGKFLSDFVLNHPYMKQALFPVLLGIVLSGAGCTTGHSGNLADADVPRDTVIVYNEEGIPEDTVVVETGKQ